eukprot:TRINITY_DN42884_c0_g1_i1.p2 TRINITY_DN42884_c0_g1~~TRINITY_DN42884_c0_g1_i1.p2  ORF type:complete len:133 (+),score=41.46 TRINITY_DN42884_c0_g1_i1:4-402(+)
MAKVVQKKSKDAISKAANSKKGTKKKWGGSERKVKGTQAVFIEEAKFNGIAKNIKTAKLVTIYTLSNQHQIGGALARRLIRHFKEAGDIVPFGTCNRHQYLYRGKDWVRKVKTEEEADDKKAKKAGKKGGKN